MNRLSGEVSPYLVQHATNPVHWWPWGDQAFAEARAANKPILLSIGYSACHWCHVMAHESFEDESTAAVMNDLFVSIKVDREERPDVDTVYMSALHTLGQQGGWPLTMFLDAEGRPFWGGTYFPKTARYGQPAFTSVLRSVAQAYATKSGDIASNAEAILAELAPSERPAYGQAIGLPLLDQCAARIRDVFDPIQGGTRGAPKFPNPPLLELLWRGANRTGDESIRDAMMTTLERMCRGGIFDHIGGGFARYSVDERWLVPHFEKMLYDNAQLIPLLALAAKHSGSPLLNAAATRSVDWLLRDMRTEHAFAASEDADSINAHGHAEEGAFYVWSPEEVRAVLGSEAPAILRDYDITASGNFEGHSIPNRLAASGLDETLTQALAHHLDRLRQHRDKRPRPGRDDKILADWNGLTITGLVRAAELLEHPEWIGYAERAYASVKKHLGSESILAHAYRAGKAVRPGFSSDHAAMALAAITLFEANGGPEYLHDAERWCRTLLDHYQTETGILAMTVAGSSDLPIRPAPTTDDAVPNANGMAAECFIRLFGLTGDVAWQNAADALIAAATHALLANPYGHASLMNAIDLRLRRVDIVIGESAGALVEVTRSIPYPNRTLKIGQPARTVPPGHATVCVEGRCSLPTDNAAVFKSLIVSGLNPAQG